MSENRYIEDQTLQQGYYDKGVVNQDHFLASAAALAGGVFAYKSGALQKGVKKFLESSSKRKPLQYVVMNDMRKWLISNEGAPEKSLFRMGFKGSLKEFFVGNKEEAQTIVERSKNIYKSTTKDVGHYLDRMNSTMDRLLKNTDKYYVSNTANNTEILHKLKYVDDAVEMYSDRMYKAKSVLTSKIYDDIIKTSKLSAKAANTQLKRRGYKSVTLEDLFDIKIEKGKVKLLEKTKFQFSDSKGKLPKEKLEEMLNANVFTDDGIVVKNSDGKNLKMFEKHKDFKNIEVDKNIRIDKDKNIIDLRDKAKSRNEFIRNLSTDWQIPFIKVNPLRMFGRDKHGKGKVLYGSISENEYAPFLTGVRGNKKGNTIRDLKDEVDILNGVDEGVTIINGDVYRINDDKTGITKLNYKSKKDLIFVPGGIERGSHTLSPNENALRKMAGYSKMSFEDYTEKDGKKYYKKKIGDFFDIGKQESAQTKENFDGILDYVNPDSYIEKIISKAKFKSYKSAKYKEDVQPIRSFKATSQKGNYFVINRGTNFKDVVNKPNSENIKKFLKQPFATFDGDHENMNKSTGYLFFLLDRMNQTISSVGLGLSLDSSKSAFDMGSSLLLKRFLPIYAAYQGFNIVNGITTTENDDGTVSNLKTASLRAAADIDIAAHELYDAVGLSKFFKNISEITPGSDMLEELPLITSLNLHQTAEEREDYWENGYDPVRKGRFWSLNTTPFVGGKIEYFKANPLRRAKADALYSDSLYGSRLEYISNLLDRDHYDVKHYYDRPYLMSSPAFENVPLVGPVLSSTVGRLIAPGEKMHMEYWNEDKPKTLDQIKHEASLNDLVLSKELKYNLKAKEQIDQDYRERDKQNLYKIFNFYNDGKQFTAEDLDKVKLIIGSKDINDIANETYMQNSSDDLYAYKTNSGQLSPVSFDQNPISAKYNINNNGYTSGQIMDFNDNPLSDQGILSDELIENIKFANPEDPNSFSRAIEDQYMDLSNVAGIYGFASTAFLTGDIGAGNTVIETSGYSRSFNRTFWDQDLGGLSGDISEIFRRFLQARRKDLNYYNPIRNTMPEFLPGENGFTDFQHGDPFCLSENTLVLTQRGYVKAKDVVSLDIILTHRGVDMPIKHKIIRPILHGEKSYSFEIANIDKKIPLEFSEEHPILIKRIKRCSYGSSCICRPHVRNYNGFCDNKKCNNKWDNEPVEFIKAKDVKVGDAVVFPIPKIDNPINKIKYSYEWRNAPRSKPYTVTNELTLTTDISWLLGLYVAEGSTAKQKGKPVRLIFSFNKNEVDIIDKTCNLLKNISGKNPKVITRGNCSEIVLCDSKIARMFDYIIPGNLYKKRIPIEIYQTFKENMIAFLLGFMLGDGSIQRNTLIGTTANENLAFDLHKLSMYAGLPARINIRNNRKSYEVSIHAFHLKDVNVDYLLYKKEKLNFKFNRQPNILSWSDGQYIYSIIKNKTEIELDKVYGFEVDVDDTFCVIGFATHNTKVHLGEERLPGEGFERINNIQYDNLLEMKMGSSTIGKTKDEIVRHILNNDKIVDPEMHKIVDGGTRTHEKLEKKMLKSGYAIDVEKEIKDEENGIIGYYDVRMHDPTSETGEAIMDIKTISAKGLEEVRKNKAPKDEHMRQVNWYLHHTNPKNKGYVYYVNRDDPEDTYMVGFDYSAKAYKSSMETVKAARHEVNELLDNNIISRADLYKPLEKFKILADVAPYSDEFRQMRKEMSGMQLEGKDKEEYDRILDRVQQQTQQTRFYDYRFKYAETSKMKSRIYGQIDDNRFILDDDDKTVVKLSGVKLKKDHPNYLKAKEFLNKYLAENEKVTIEYSADESERHNTDMHKSVNAIIYSNGMNINKELINRGLAEEQEDDYSATAVKARFNPFQRVFGSIWESVAHFDSIANTKMLQVRTALEDYERNQVYGDDFRKWENPIQDFVKPAIWSNINRPGGVLIGAGIGYLFGTKGSKFGKLIGTTVGAGSVIAGKIYKGIFETVTGDKWIPKVKEKERELNDYVDKLNYVKNRRLFEVYAQKALNEDGIDVKQMIEDNKEIGKERKRKANKIKKAKAISQIKGEYDLDEFRKAGVKFKDDDKPLINKFVDFMSGVFDMSKSKKAKEIIDKSVDNIIYNNVEDEQTKENIEHKIEKREEEEKHIQEEKEEQEKQEKRDIKQAISDATKENTENRKVFNLSKNAAIALDYYNKSEQTMYGYDPGESLQNFMSALPKEDRKYFKEFINASERDREKILQIAPKYMRRALQSRYGMKVDEKEDLDSYFTEHYLPSDDWDGWQESYDMNSMKVKMVQSQNMDLNDFNLWQDDKMKADLYGPTAIPNMEYKTNDIQSVRTKLKKLLGAAGYENLNIETSYGFGGNNIDLQMYEDRKEKYESKLKDRLGVI